MVGKGGSLAKLKRARERQGCLRDQPGFFFSKAFVLDSSCSLGFKRCPRSTSASLSLSFPLSLHSFLSFFSFLFAFLPSLTRATVYTAPVLPADLCTDWSWVQFYLGTYCLHSADKRCMHVFPIPFSLLFPLPNAEWFCRSFPPHRNLPLRVSLTFLLVTVLCSKTISPWAVFSNLTSWHIVRLEINSMGCNRCLRKE